MNHLLRKTLLGSAATITLAAGTSAQADDTITFGLLQDFTAVYTFVTDEYHQGQQDYLELINQRGGIEGKTFDTFVRDTGNEPDRGIEAYSRARGEGAVLVDFLSTPVSRAIVDRALDDETVMITPLHGRGDASHGETFPYVFPMMATYWAQATALIDYIDEHRGGLEGKTIAHVYIDTPFGREPIPVLEELAEREGFQLETFAYPTPGTEQSATWSNVRRARPDHVLIWGAGGGQPVSVREAIRNGIAPEDILSVVWLAETDANTVGRDRFEGVRRFEAVAAGTDYPIIEAIQEEVIEPGHGSGSEENVGTSYYNIGVATMAVAVEAARNAIEEHGVVTGETLRDGFYGIEDYDAEGLMPPVTFSPDDHQGGGMGRVSKWDGDSWEPLTDWFSAHEDVVWEAIERDAADFRD